MCFHPNRDDDACITYICPLIVYNPILIFQFGQASFVQWNNCKFLSIASSSASF